ncbi:Uncharacterised protein [Metamycoplasma cloacale]|nr:aromatic motif membrane protein [Metamycoplasma cloacale]VEU79320.1 Uncharacterised protein [Metamycoplasma cloacale]
MFRKINTLFLSIPLIVTPIAVVSCQSQEIKENITNNNINSVINEKNDWNIFIDNVFIQKILNILYNDNQENEKQEYIEKQTNLKTEYFNTLKKTLFFNNSLINIFGNEALSNTDKPFFTKDKQKNQFNQLFEENWLFYLYNINHFTYMYFPVFDQFNSNINNTIKKVHENNLTLGAFFSPKSNKIIDFSIQETKNNNDETILDFYLLTEEGFIINLTVTKNNKLLEQIKDKINEVITDTEDFVFYEFKNHQDLLNDLKNYLNEIKTKISQQEKWEQANELYKEVVKMITNFRNENIRLENGTDFIKEDLFVFKEKTISIIPYIWTFPKLYEAPDKLDIFDLNKFIIATRSFYDLDDNTTNQILFKEKYGGELLKYTLIDIN